MLTFNTLLESISVAPAQTRKAPTVADLKNTKDGKETSVDRTRRLFYVTCSRARSSLALVAYPSDPGAVRKYVVANGWFSADEVL